MSNDTILPFGFPAVGGKKLTAAFEGERITADGGVLLLGAVERRLGIATKLARLIADPRNPALVTPGFAVPGHTRRGVLPGKPQFSWVFAPATAEKMRKT